VHAVGVKSALVLIAATLVVVGCASPPPATPTSSTLTRLVGKSQAAILSCAGPPIMEVSQGELTILRYYKEAPMMEESAVTSKTSRPGLHHGCWANLGIEHHQVTGIEFRTVPEGVTGDGDCEAIFKACHAD